MVKLWPDQPDRFRRPCDNLHSVKQQYMGYYLWYYIATPPITHLSTHHVIVTRVSLIPDRIPDRFFPSLVNQTFFPFIFGKKVSLVHETTFFPGFFDDQTKTEKALQKALE